MRAFVAAFAFALIALALVALTAQRVESAAAAGDLQHHTQAVRNRVTALREAHGSQAQAHGGPDSHRPTPHKPDLDRLWRDAKLPPGDLGRFRNWLMKEHKKKKPCVPHTHFQKIADVVDAHNKWKNRATLCKDKEEPAPGSKPGAAGAAGAPASSGGAPASGRGAR